MGLSVSPGNFQAHTHRHVRKFKQQPAVQQLLKNESVVEVLMDDFLFGSPTATEHDKLLRAWCAYSELESLYFKRAKCTLGAKTVVVLGRKDGYREWGPDTEKFGQLPLIVELLNLRSRFPSGFSAAELFLGRAQWPLLRRDVDCRFEENKLAEISLLVDRLFKERNARRSRLPRRPASVIRPGMYVFVHISRFPSHAAQCSKVDLP